MYTKMQETNVQFSDSQYTPFPSTTFGSKPGTSVTEIHAAKQSLSSRFIVSICNTKIHYTLYTYKKVFSFLQFENSKHAHK